MVLPFSRALRPGFCSPEMKSEPDSYIQGETMPEPSQQLQNNVFLQNVISRKEGEEYLLYNRNSDELLIFRKEGYEGILYLYQNRNLQKAAELLSEKYRLSPEAATQIIQNSTSEAAAKGLLQKGFLSTIEFDLLSPQQLERSTKRQMRLIGDLTVAAWAISAAVKRSTNN